MPITEPAWVRPASVPALATRAMPKSATFTSPVPVTRMLPGFTSRWTTPLRWAKPRAAATSLASAAARPAGSLPSARSTSASVRPFTYSMTMKYVPPCWPQS